MTGAELIARAKQLNVNPYYLAYALATGVNTPKEAFERDGGNHEFAIWNDRIWHQQAKATGETREFVSGAADAFDRHCDMCAALIPHGATADAS
jgi:hypothetical protein